MLTIVEINAREDGGHGLQSQSGRVQNWMGPEWIEVPANLEAAIWDCCGYCDLVIENNKLISITPKEKPEPQVPQQIPTTEERLSAVESAILSMIMKEGV